jgi:hypothetical protein
MSRFIQIGDGADPIFVNVSNILYVTRRGDGIPVLVMLNGLALACLNTSFDDIMSRLAEEDPPKTEIPDAILNSFREVWDNEDPEQPNDTPTEVDTDEEDHVEYKDGGENPRSDDDLMPN